jgi:hypothetical protein
LSGISPRFPSPDDGPFDVHGSESAAAPPVESVASSRSAERPAPPPSTLSAMVLRAAIGAHPAAATREIARLAPVAVSTPEEALAQMRLIRDRLTAEPPPRNNLGALAPVSAETLDAFIQKAASYERAGEPAKARAFGEVMVGLANCHFAALAAFERGDMSQVPEPYRIAFGKAVEVPPASLGAVLAAANWAHVWYDLPTTLRDLAAKGRPGFDLSSAADRAAFIETNAALAGVEKKWIAGLDRAYPGNTFTPQLRVLGAVPGLDLGGQVGWTREKAWDLAARPGVTDGRLSKAVVGLSRASIVAVAVGDAIFAAAHKVEASGDAIVDAAHKVGRAAKAAWRELGSVV